MLVWLASFPRSGNTFFRVAAHAAFGVPTTSAYDVDGPATRAGAERLGAVPRPDDLASLVADARCWLVHTHKAPPDVAHPAIHVVRDGRDALLSRSLQLVESGRSATVAEAFAALVDEPLDPANPSVGGWGVKVGAWLVRRPAPHLVRYADLIADPVGVVGAALEAVAPGASSPTGRPVPTFAELHEHDPGFFRRGVSGSHADELDPALEAMFWAVPANAAAMARLGLARWVSGGSPSSGSR